MATDENAGKFEGQTQQRLTRANRLRCRCMHSHEKQCLLKNSVLYSTLVSQGFGSSHSGPFCGVRQAAMAKAKMQCDSTSASSAGV